LGDLRNVSVQFHPVRRDPAQGIHPDAARVYLRDGANSSSVTFGFAINTDPKDLPVAVLARTTVLRAGLSTPWKTAPITIVDHVETEEAARRLLARGEVQLF
jgi:hypothetical protein